MPLTFVPADNDTTPLHIVGSDMLDAWMSTCSSEQAAWIRRNGFTGALGSALLVPGLAVAGYGTAKTRARGRFHLAAAAASLPEGSYKIVTDLPKAELEEAALGWLLAGYAFDRYRARTGATARLVAPEGIDAARIEALAAGETLTRDLINTPASDMGPAELEAAFLTLAAEFDAETEVIRGDSLLDRNFPMIHAVGRASDRAPRLLDMRWGTSGPQLTLVGKGVCFDTGGLNLKPGASMGLMKKDMGGAATVLGLAQTIMMLDLPLRLRVLIPAVENSVSGSSFRPQDILTSRKGLTVEINNTDAEGRLVLADALALADEEETDLIVSMATLTGAARVAVGPDLAPFYTDDEAVAQAVFEAGHHVADPVWRLPLWNPYDNLIEPGIADLDNAPSGGMAGSITAALFLRQFVERARYLHFDIYGWQPNPQPARPKGGVGQGARAVLEALPKILSL